MRIAYVANPDIPIPVEEGYGGLERQVTWISAEMIRRGHEVTIYGNVPLGPSKWGWVGRPIFSQHDILTHADELPAFDVVHDRTKDHPTRLLPTVRSLHTVVWSDQPTRPAVYPSEAVREFYKDPTAPVIPECVPVDELPFPNWGDYFLCFGRIDPIKGQDLAVAVAVHHGAKLVVAGHVGRWGDQYYALTIRELCRRAGFEFVPNPTNSEVRKLIGNAQGLIHTHRWLESFSEVVAEALCQGVPVLTTDPGAPKEWVDTTTGGCIVRLQDLESGNFDGCRKFFDWMKSGAYDSTHRDHIQQAARGLFNVQRVASLYEEVYKRVAGPA
jgi:glycosyltransferase involved in cell wall biosynthesis